MLRSRQKLLLLFCLVVLGSEILTQGVPCSAQSRENNNALVRSVKENNTPAVKKWLDKGASVNAQEPNGLTVLGLAVGQSNLAIVRLLLDGGAAINAAYNDGITPLMDASQRGNAELVELLLSRKARIDARDNAGRTALMWAAIAARPVAVKALLAHNANKEATDNSEQTALTLVNHIVDSIRATGGKTYPSMRLASQIIWGRGEEYMRAHHTGHADMKVVIARLLSDYASVVKALGPQNVGQTTLTHKEKSKR